MPSETTLDRVARAMRYRVTSFDSSYGYWFVEDSDCVLQSGPLPKDEAESYCSQMNLRAALTALAAEPITPAMVAAWEAARPTSRTESESEEDWCAADFRALIGAILAESGS